MVESITEDIKDYGIRIFATLLVGSSYLRKNWDREDTEVVLKGFGYSVLGYVLLVLVCVNCD